MFSNFSQKTIRHTSAKHHRTIESWSRIRFNEKPSDLEYQQIGAVNITIPDFSKISQTNGIVF